MAASEINPHWQSAFGYIIHPISPPAPRRVVAIPDSLLLSPAE